MALSPIEGDTQRFCSQVGLNQSLQLLERAWQSELGGLSRMAEIVALDNFALVVEVHSSAAMQEISLRRRELLRRINGYFKDPILRNITVRMAQKHGH